MPSSSFNSLAINSLDDFVFGRAPHPLRLSNGLAFGDGQVVPEINFTLPAIAIEDGTWPQIRDEYSEMMSGVCRRAVELEVPGLLVEFETLPPMTDRPDWGLEICRLLKEELEKFQAKDGLKSALRVTPNDNRCHERPPRMRQGQYWQNMVRFFEGVSETGADLFAIESTGGKELSDEALMNANLRELLFALGVLGARDMRLLWDHILSICAQSNIVPSGDTACAFANTAMVLADQKMIPRVLAAVVRVASVPRSLIAFERGAVGPSKDCAYEGPYLKAITGAPISMEGKTAACAHLSPVGNIAQALCDCWSNESTANVKLLSAKAPIVSLEQLVYDCRLMNIAGRKLEDARRLRDWLAESDAAIDPQAWVLRPDVVLHLARGILTERTPYRRTRLAMLLTLEEIGKAAASGALRLAPREIRWMDLLQKQAENLPEEQEELTREILASPSASAFLPAEYDL